MSEVDRRIYEPFYDEPFLKWYDGIFDAVYIALHPFYFIEGVDPSKSERRNLNFLRADIEGALSIEKLNKISEANSNYYEIGSESIQFLQKQKGVKIAWNEVRSACGFNSLSQVNRALKTLIRSLRPEFSSEGDALHLASFCSSKKMFLPDEDVIPPVLENSIWRLLGLLKSPEVTIVDEFADYKAIVSINDLNTELPWIKSGLLTFHPSRIYTEDHSFLISASWDNFYTAICGNRLLLESVRLSELFDGFWCDLNTRPEWWSEGPISSEHGEN